MKKRDFETYQKRLRDFEILPKFSETHVFRGTIRHPSAFPGRIYRTRRSTDPPRVCDIFQCADPRSFNLDNQSSIHQSTESPLVTLITAISHV